MNRRLAPLLTLLDAAVLAVLLCLAVDQLRSLLVGQDRVDPWILSAGPWIVLPAVGLHGAARLLPAPSAVVGRGALLVLAAVCLLDASAWYALRRQGVILSAGVVPASLAFAALLLLGVLLPRPRPRRTGPVARLGAVTLSAFLLVLLHLHTFGQTDYRQHADAALVFGARVHADGRASAVLRDRTVTACRLWEQGWVRHLVFSGGKAEDAPISEPVAMARIARARGIPDEAIVLDEEGRNTWASILGAARVARERDWTRVLAVSTDVHLARIRLLARKAGLDVRTVPAIESLPWPKRAFVLRELLAWGWWYLRTALG